MLKTVGLRDYMLSNPVKVNENDNLMDAMQTIIDNKISGVCVVNASGKLVGILSELDCLDAVLGATYNESGIGKVREYMTNDELIVAHLNEAIVDVAQDMLKRNHRRRPVLDGGKLVGQITVRQLLKAVKDFKR